MIKDQYRKVTDVYKRKCEEMRTQITRETTKTEVQDRRRKCEIEGVASDLQNMKRKCDFYQKYIGKLRTLVNEDARQPEEQSVIEDMYN